jgi:opacity protein-like surface antigen
MARFSIFASAGIAAFAFAAAAQAADAPDYPPMYEPPATVQEFASGWYIRGDIGYRMNRLDGSSNALGYSMFNESMDDVASFGGGGGYKAGWFRADVTVDFARSTYKGDVGNAVLPGGQPGLSTRIESTTALVNMYADLGTWGRLTPYIGAGIGAANLRTKEFYDAGDPTTRGANNDKWNFAWAAIAGLSYRISNSLTLDASYRWLDLGSAPTSVNALGNQLNVKDITAHELRIGVRYDLD